MMMHLQPPTSSSRPLDLVLEGCRFDAFFGSTKKSAPAHIPAFPLTMSWLSDRDHSVSGIEPDEGGSGRWRREYDGVRR